MRREVVEKRKWQTAGEFNDLFALCQFLPGPNIVNYAVCLGSRFNGIPGALACLAGVLTGPMTIVLSLGALYAQYGGVPVVQRGFVGLAAAAAGLVLATAIKIALPLAGRPLGIAIALLAFVVIAVLRLPLLPSMLVLTPLSILLHAGAAARGRAGR